MINWPVSGRAVNSRSKRPSEEMYERPNSVRSLSRQRPRAISLGTSLQLHQYRRAFRWPRLRDIHRFCFCATNSPTTDGFRAARISTDRSDISPAWPAPSPFATAPFRCCADEEHIPEVKATTHLSRADDGDCWRQTVLRTIAVVDPSFFQVIRCSSLREIRPVFSPSLSRSSCLRESLGNTSVISIRRENL